MYECLYACCLGSTVAAHCRWRGVPGVPDSNLPACSGPPLSEGPLRLCGRDPASPMLTDTQLDDRQPTLEGLP